MSLTHSTDIFLEPDLLHIVLGMLYSAAYELAFELVNCAACFNFALSVGYWCYWLFTEKSECWIMVLVTCWIRIHEKRASSWNPHTKKLIEMSGKRYLVLVTPVQLPFEPNHWTHLGSVECGVPLSNEEYFNWWKSLKYSFELSGTARTFIVPAAKMLFFIFTPPHLLRCEFIYSKVVYWRVATSVQLLLWLATDSPNQQWRRF